MRVSFCSSVVVKTFFEILRPRPRPLGSGLETETKTFGLRSRDRDQDLWAQVWRPRPRLLGSGLETETKTFGFRSRDRDQDLWVQVSRPRPRPLGLGLETKTETWEKWTRVHSSLGFEITTLRLVTSTGHHVPNSYAPYGLRDCMRPDEDCKQSSLVGLRSLHWNLSSHQIKQITRQVFILTLTFCGSADAAIICELL